jgi:uncharacterized phage infection (PIP) family protein YhgE
MFDMAPASAANPGLLDAPAVPGSPLNFSLTGAEKRDFSAELRSQTLACRVRHEKLGVRKALTKEQKQQAAEPFDADYRSLSVSKKLLDTKDPAYKRVTSIRSQAGKYWKAVTTPYPEQGIRLIRKSAVKAFDDKMEALQAELAEAVAQLQEKYDELRERARETLGDLFNEDDYPSRVDDQFSLDWDYPSIEPPAYLKNLHPELYEREAARMKQRFDEAVRLTEEAFTQQFQQLVAHLAERLKGEADGKAKVFKDSSIHRLTKFFEAFRSLDTGSNTALQQLVNQAQQVVQGISADDIRASDDLRARLASQLGEVQAAVDGLMVNKPTRALDLAE